MIKISGEKESKIVLPVNVSISFFNRVLKAYFELKAHENPINLNDLAEVVGSSKPNVSSTNSFLIALKAVDKKGREFLLTENGRKYAQAITWGIEQDAKQSLKELLSEYELTKKTISYIKVNPDATYDDLTKRIGIISGNALTKGTERAISSFINFLYEADLIHEDDNKIRIKNSEEPYSIIKHAVQKSPDKKRSIFDNSTEFNFLIQVNIDSSMSESDVIKLIKAARKGVSEPLDDDDQTLTE